MRFLYLLVFKNKHCNPFTKVDIDAKQTPIATHYTSLDTMLRVWDIGPFNGKCALGIIGIFVFTSDNNHSWWFLDIK